MPSISNRVEIIDGLRGIAILGVLWHHLFSYLTPPGFGGIAIGELVVPTLSVLSNGWLGVNLFFLLSGFVLALPYLRGERHFDTAADLKDYYFRRARRLLPLYYVVLAGSFALITPTISDVLILATATHTFTHDLWLPRYNWVLWSLGLEIWFSIIFPALMVACLRFGTARVLVGTLIFSFTVRCIGTAEMFDLNVYLSTVRDSLAGRLDDFVAGMFVAWIFVHVKPDGDRGWARGWILGAGLTLVFVGCLLWDLVAMGTLSRYVTPAINLVLMAGFSLVTLFGLFREGPALDLLLKNRPLRLTGIMCYSIYVWHGLLITVVGEAEITASIFDATLWLGVLAGISILSFRWIEFGHVKNFRLPQ